MEQEKLELEKEKFEALFQHASMGIIVTNNNTEIILVNNFLLEQFGYQKQEELIGKRIETLIPTRYHKKHVSHVDQYQKNPGHRPMGLGNDLFAVKKDGTEFPVEISLSHYAHRDDKFAIAFVSDITTRKKFEHAIDRQKEQLSSSYKKIEELNNDLEHKVETRTKQLKETLTKLESSKDKLTKALSKEKELSDLKSRFVSMASHEFRTPLSTILSSASLVAKYVEAEEQDKRDKHIQRIKSSVTNLTNLLNEFLSLGKIEDGKITATNVVFNIKDLFSVLCAEMEHLARKDQTFVYTHKGEEIVFSDPNLLRNVITNLLSNSIKFSSEGGAIELNSTVTSSHIHITVEDNGIGIPKEDQEHLFERFFRGKNVVNVQGTGLGLHIVGKYIEILDGQIEFESVLEKGTKFTIQLNRQMPKQPNDFSI